VLTEADDRIGAPRVVVISHRLWQRLFDGRADALGQTIVLAGVPATVVGVMPVGFTFPDTEIDFWIPAQLSAALRASRTEFYLTILGRLADGVAPGAARAELDTIMARLRASFPEANGAVDPQPVERGQRFIVELQHSARMFEQQCARLAQHLAAAGLHEQRPADPMLERLHLKADSAGRAMHRRCSASESAEIYGEHEASQAVQIQRLHRLGKLNNRTR